MSEPTFNAQLEQSLLAPLLTDDGAWDAVSDIFSTDLFFDPVNRAIAAAIAALHEDGEPVDPVTVNRRLQTGGKLGAGGVDPDYCLGLYRAIGATGNLRYYAEKLGELAATRSIQRAAARMLSDSAGTPAQQLERARAELDGIEVGRPQGAVSMGSVVDLVMADIKARAEDAANGISRSLQSGFQGLDDLTGGFSPGLLYVFAARPGKGKSALAVALADNLASRGAPVGVFWLEDDRLDFGRRAVARRSKVSAAKLRDGRGVAPEMGRAAAAGAELRKLPIYLIDAHGLSAAEISLLMRRMHREHGCKVFILDHHGEVALDRQNSWGDRHDLAVGAAVRAYRDTAKALGAVPILFAQMNREAERRADASPRMSDIEGSRHIEQAARFVAFLGLPGGDRFQLLIRKNTNGPNGQDLNFRWLADSMCVEEDAPVRISPLAGWPGEEAKGATCGD